MRMKNIFYKGIAGLALLLWFCCLPVSAQNFYIEILDAETYQPIQDVKVEMESASTKITFYSSPFGGVSDNVPAGVYTVTMTRSGYVSRQETNIRILAHELNTFTFRMTPGEDTGAGQSGRERIRPPMVETTKPARRAFFDLGYQFGNIQGLQAGIGYYVFRDAWLRLAYARSSQKYTGEFFINPEQEYKVGFNKVWLGLGYDFVFPLNARMGFMASPGVLAGMEMASNKDFIAHESVDVMMTPSLLPQLNVGFYYIRFAVFVEANYSFWLMEPVTQDRFMIENGNNGKPVKWGDELFPGRKGLGIVAGLRLYL
jgi:hypothetical protein